jgi:hypothetical protein
MSFMQNLKTQKERRRMSEPTLLGEILVKPMENIKKAYEERQNERYEKSKPASLAV